MTKSDPVWTKRCRGSSFSQWFVFFQMTVKDEIKLREDTQGIYVSSYRDYSQITHSGTSGMSQYRSLDLLTEGAGTTKDITIIQRANHVCVCCGGLDVLLIYT